MPTNGEMVGSSNATGSAHDRSVLADVRERADEVMMTTDGATVSGHVERPVVADVETARVSLVIPTKNEALNVAWVLEQIPACVDEVIIVDANSSDATIVTAMSCRGDLRVVAQQGVGKGDALRAGCQAATGDVVVMMDSDGSMAPQEIPHFLHFLCNGYDFVKGSRFIGGGGSLDITLTRRLGNRGLLHVFNFLYGVHLTDLCYGFFAFHRRYLPFLDITTTGFEVETQLTISAVRGGLRIAEVPSLEMPRRHGRSHLRTFRDGVRVLHTILREHRVRPDVTPRRAELTTAGRGAESHPS